MFKFNKVAVICSALFFSSLASAADPSASVVWQGLVPSVEAGDTMTITGFDGNEIKKGSLNVLSDGTFSSNTVQLEARLIDNEGVAGELTSASWKLASTELIMGATDVSPAIIEVSNNGVLMEIGVAVDDKESLQLSVSQSVNLPGAEGSAQVQVTLVASSNV